MFLHGFGSSARSWDAVISHLDASRYRSVTVDLPGHGTSADVMPASYARAVDLTLAAAPGPLVLCGYSMGARVALAAALADPARADALVLVSGHAGIEDPAERAARRASDEELAGRLEGMTPGELADAWNAQPLFASDPPAVLAAAREDLLRQRPRSLAAALRGLGPGAFEPAWAQLGTLAAPLVAVAGERDERYRDLALRLARTAPSGSALTAPGGHRVPLESPRAVVAALDGLDAEPR